MYKKVSIWNYGLNINYNKLYDIRITYIRDTSNWDTLACANVKWSSCSKLRRYRGQRVEREAHFDGNLNNGNPIVAQTYNLFESQLHNRTCASCVWGIYRACDAYEKLNLWSLSASFITRNVILSLQWELTLIFYWIFL